MHSQHVNDPALLMPGTSRRQNLEATNDSPGLDSGVPHVLDLLLVIDDLCVSGDAGPVGRVLVVVGDVDLGIALQLGELS